LTTLLKQAKRFAPEQRHAAMDKAGLEALVETAFDYDPRRHGEYWASAKPYIEEAIVNAARIA
jgi:hypothetical protein